MNRKRQTAKYIISDLLSAAIAWFIFYSFRKIYIESPKFGVEVPIEYNTRFYLGMILVPLFWLSLYYISGYYKNIYRKSRLKELGQTILITGLGVIIIFFTLILDDTIGRYTNYYQSFLTLYGLHFIFTYLPRLILTTRTNHKIQNRKMGFNTIIIGSNQKALSLYKDLTGQKKSEGNMFIGFVSVNEKARYLLNQELEHLGHITELPQLINKHQIEEVIIAIETSEHEQIGKIINHLQGKNTIIKVIPDMYDILTGSVRMSSFYGAPLIQISHEIMPAWQQNVKRILDVFVSIVGIIMLSPLYIFLMMGVKLSSRGPIFYSHERIGQFGKPFTIYKFRSMFVDAEKHGPALSSKNDSRITKFGKFMRKSRLDELPQFYNVLVGDMSLVGPRPERQFFIDLITEKAPHYVHLQKVKPGITSWGQVKFGYAENVDEMVERLKYDIIYIENMSLYVDFKIMIYTLKVILKIEGK